MRDYEYTLSRLPELKKAKELQQLQVTVLKEYYEDMVEDCRTMGLRILTASFSDDAATMILEGPKDAIDTMQDFLNGVSFI